MLNWEHLFGVGLCATSRDSEEENSLHLAFLSVSRKPTGLGKASVAAREEERGGGVATRAQSPWEPGPRPLASSLLLTPTALHSDFRLLSIQEILPVF